MVGSSYDQKPYRRSMMETWGRPCIRSPSDTQAGPRAGRAPDRLAGDRDLRGGRGRRRAREDTNYALGSVLNHVLLHQTVIGQEAVAQMEMAGEQPDVVIGCVGGGSNFAGLAFPFVRERAARRREARRASWPPSPPPARR